ncbi:MAG: hypothetical protein GY787_29960 [Alteromonadales bacterium]|nr:hypothetical protein [Alteromonadales bacterium]
MTNETEKPEANTELGGRVDSVVMRDACWEYEALEAAKEANDGKTGKEADEYNTDTPYYSDYDMEITHWMPIPKAFGA